MGCSKQIYGDEANLKELDSYNNNNSDNCDSISSIETSSSSSSLEDSIDDHSAASSPSSESMEDNDSTSSSSSPPYGPLFDLFELMEQLPIKRGLSKYYQGQSQSFASMASVKSLEDLAKKTSPVSNYRKKMMMKSSSCKSYGGGGLKTGIHRSFSPKPTISKKAKRGSNSAAAAAYRFPPTSGLHKC